MSVESKAIRRIHIVNGPNLNLLGKREPEIYGTQSFEEYFKSLKKEFSAVHLAYFQSNHEGALIDYLHHHGFEEQTGIILNAGGLTHTSISLRDAVAAIPAPVVEVHIGDIYNREPFRAHSYLKDVCKESIVGEGMDGYAKGIRWLMGY